MTKKQKYIIKTIARAINCILAIAIVVAIVAITLPANIQLFFLRTERSAINRIAQQSGWTEHLSTSWEYSLEQVREVSESSAYGEFMVRSSDFVQLLVVLAEFALCTIFALRACNYGENVIRRVKNILYHTRRR